MNMKNLKFVMTAIVALGSLYFMSTKFMDKKSDEAPQNYTESNDGVVVQKVWPCDRNSDCFYGPCSEGLCKSM